MDESLISLQTGKNEKDIFKSTQKQPNLNVYNKKNINVINNKKNINTIKNSIKSNKNIDIKKGSFYKPLFDFEKRKSLPAKSKEVSFNIFKILKDVIGKDLNHFAIQQVILNEPLSMLQKLCENFQYADLLNKAAKEDNPHLRLAYVACFNIGGLTMNIHRAKKLFNPILFETLNILIIN